MIEKEERRHHRRVPYLNSLSFKLCGRSLPEKFLKQADILDISSGGLRIRMVSLETNFEIDSLIFLNIPLPRMPITIPALGKIKWIVLDDHKTRQAGIQFIISD